MVVVDDLRDRRLQLCCMYLIFRATASTIEFIPFPYLPITHSTHPPLFYPPPATDVEDLRALVACLRAAGCDKSCSACRVKKFS